MRIAAGLVLASFLLAFSLSITGWFERFSAATLFGMGGFLSASGFLILHWLSEKFRIFVRARSIRRLTLGQTLRFFGLLALVKAYQHVLPALFAVPTGLIDVAFAGTSFFVAARLVRADGTARPGFIAWHFLGLLGLAVSVVLAILTSSTRFGLVTADHTSQPMTWFPMSLVPVFIGPMVLIFHLLAIAVALEHRKVAG